MTILAGINSKASLLFNSFSRCSSSVLSRYTALTSPEDHTTSLFFTILLKLLILGLSVGIVNNVWRDEDRSF